MMRKEKAVFFIEEACLTGAKQNKACTLLGITDIYSRKIVGWKFYDRQNYDLSSSLLVTL